MRHTLTNLGLLLVALSGCSLEDFDQDGVPRLEDCNDTDPSQGRPLPLHVDGDRDGFGGPDIEVGCPGNAWLVSDASDCNDANAGVRPFAQEIACDGRDNDCDPTTVDGPAVTGGVTYASVQQAIDAAALNDVVEICASLVDGPLVVRKPTVLRGAGRNRTVIDAKRGGSALTLESTAELRDLTLTGGLGGRGGGLHVLEGVGGTIRLDEVTIRGNAADDGGGIWASGTAMELTNVEVSANVATNQGGGIAVQTPPDRPLLLVDTQVFRNRALLGGGLWVLGRAQAERTAVYDNSADQGGGIWFDGILESGKATFYVDDNEARTGGGIWGAGQLVGVALHENEGEQGGGLFNAAELVVRNSSLAQNTSTGDGGGVLAAGPLTLISTTASGNVASGDGGGIAASGDLVLQHSFVERNRASRGGGLAIRGAAELEGVAVSENVALSAGGGLHTSCHQGGVRMTSGTLRENQAPSGGALWIEGAEVSLIGLQVDRNSSGIQGAVAVMPSSCGHDSVLDARDDVSWRDNVRFDLWAAGTGLTAPNGVFRCVVGGDGTIACPAPP